MVKKIIALVALGITLSNNIAKANEINEDLYEKKENKVKFSVNKELLKDENGNYREEYYKDRLGLESVFELKKKTTSKYEVAIANDDGTFSYVDKANSYDIAKNLLEKDNTEKNYCIIDESGRVIYAEEALGRVIKYIDGVIDPTVKNITNIYDSSNMKNAYTYINHGYIDDVPIIEDLGTKAKIEVASYKGWINKDSEANEQDLVVVPLNQVLNPSHYIVRNGELLHFLSNDILSKNKVGYYIKLGPAPSFLSEEKEYYSYDGEFFYSSLKVLLSDLKNDTNENAVNKNNKFYSYYLNLPFRSKTKITENEINKFIRDNTVASSKLRETGASFLKAEEKYGVNALLMLGIAINESSWGNSQIAKEKNNLFGINAIDSNPGQAAGSFETVEGCIMDFAKHYISKGYSNPTDWRYYGGILGNKEFGANVKYASDPFWGEKASKFYYDADLNAAGDNKNNLRDYNSYQLAISTEDSKVINESGDLLYLVSKGKVTGNELVGTPFILKESSIYKINNINNYKIYPKRTTHASDKNFSGEYDWNFDGYTESNKVELINKKKTVEIDYEKDGWQNVENIWYYILDGELCKGWKEIKGQWYYFNSDGSMRTGWKKSNGKWYYLKENGAMKKGWEKIDNEWYYFNADGIMKTGWVYYKKIWYYLGNDGAMVTEWKKIDGKWYYFNNNGEMVKGWLTNNNSKYYLEADGSMVIGWKKINSEWYYFDSKGKMKRGWSYQEEKWYYLKDSGIMAKGWNKVDDEWYYFYSNGSMAKNTKIDGYIIDKNGVSNKK